MPWRRRAEPRVRAMRATDVPIVGAIFREAFNEIYTRRGYGPVVADESVGSVIADTYRALDPANCIVVEREGELIASGFLHVRGSTAGAGPITVLPAHQGTGVGLRLMQEVCRQADQAGVQSLRLIQDAFNETAFALYGSVGFVCREVLARTSFRSDRRPVDGTGCRRATTRDLEGIVALETGLLGLRRRCDYELLLRVGEVFVGERAGIRSSIARIVRGRVAVLGPAVAASLGEMVQLIDFATRDLPPGTDTRLLLPARSPDLQSALVGRSLEVHSLCLYMVRGEYEPFRGYYVPTLFPESG
jgi:GNAT superfamily N-acetyltransferase